MKLLKKILLLVVLLLAIAAVIGFLLPGKLTLERTLVMKAPPSVVFNQVNTLKNWENWSPWYKMDPKQKMDFNEIAAGVNASYHWKGEKTMEGTMTIIDSKSDELVTCKLEFAGDETPAFASFILTPEGSGTKVVWNFSAESGMNPYKKIFMFTAMKAMLGVSFE
ncbi:MAG: SRPBCC family protein, partial [Bacteroidia bacterium]